MQNQGQVGNENELQQRQQDVWAVGGNDGGDQSKYAEWGDRDDHMHDLDANLAHAVHEIGNRLSLFTRCEDTETEEEGDDDDLQHAGVRHGLDEVTGENVHDGIDKRGGFFCLIVQFIGRKSVACSNVEDVGNY